MPATRTAIDESLATYQEDLAANTYVAAHLVQSAAVLHLAEGLAATTITIQRHPVVDNNGRTAPADNSADWVNAQAPVVVDLSAGQGSIIKITGEVVGWYKFKADKACKSWFTTQEG